MTYELFNQIAAAHAPLDGWCTQSKALTLASIIITQRPSVALEVGIFGGKSFIPMAMALKAVNPGGVIIGIDPWSKSIAVQEQTQEVDRKWWAEIDLELIRLKFMAALKQHDLEGISRIERKASQNVPSPQRIDVLHVDGAHNETAHQDMVKFASRVVVGGYCITDDSNWHGGGVSRGERWLVENGFRRLYVLEDGAVFQRIR